MLYLAIALVETPGWCLDAKVTRTSECLSDDYQHVYWTWGWRMLTGAESLALETACLIAFCVDLAAKAYAMGGWRFLRGRGHVLQVSIIFVAFLDLAFAASPVLWQRTHITRPMRALFVLCSHRKLRDTSAAVIAMLPSLAEALFLLVAFTLFCAVMGVLLFSEWPGASDGFATLGDAVYSLSMLLTSTNFPDVALPSYRAERFTMLYFAGFQVLCVFGGLNIIFALVYRSYCAHMRAEAARIHRNRLHACVPPSVSCAARRSPASRCRRSRTHASRRSSRGCAPTCCRGSSASSSRRSTSTSAARSSSTSLARSCTPCTCASRFRRGSPSRGATGCGCGCASFSPTGASPSASTSPSRSTRSSSCCRSPPSTRAPRATRRTRRAAGSAAPPPPPAYRTISCAAQIGEQLPFLLLWLVEGAARVLAYGWRQGLLGKGLPLFDAALTACGCVSLVVNLNSDCNPDAGALVLMRAFMLLRLLRLLRLLGYSRRFTLLLSALSSMGRPSPSSPACSSRTSTSSR